MWSQTDLLELFDELVFREAKKLCKKLKIPNDESFLLKHYKDGEFNKDYDRKYNEKSITNFMKDPTGDLPWEEDDSAKDVVHIPDPNVCIKFLLFTLIIIDIKSVKSLCHVKIKILI